MGLIVESESLNMLDEITNILKLLVTEKMSEDEFLSIKQKWFTQRYMFGGFQHAINELREFWRKNEAGLKSYRLFTYKGIDLFLKKLEENSKQFFYKGGDMNLTFTEKELDSIRLTSSKYREKWINGGVK